MTDVWEAPGGTTTIKGGEGYEASWHVFSGSPGARKEAIIEYFGMDRDSVAGLTPFEVASQAEAIVQGTGNAIRTLGAKPVSSDSAEADTSRLAQAAAKAKAQEPEKSPLYGEIERAADIDALKRIWGESKKEFEADPELLKAWKARGKALKSG